MGEIGRRAAAEIRRVAHENGTSYADEMDFIQMHRSQLWQWEHDVADPVAKPLSRMALAGYDIHYILTGERK